MTHNKDFNDAENHTNQDSQRAQRRRLLKRGALLAPVVLTLHARPAFAGLTSGNYGYCSYNVVSGEVQGQTGECWHTQDEARQHDQHQ